MLRSALTILLALASAQAAALGLGQIEVRSKLNEPLLAEIPVISNDPAELEQLQARLASPETFARVGLEPPRGTVADLQFAVALDARGQTVIRVTSSQPVSTALLIFLVEVDSGQSRVVREYSALVDAPRNAPIAMGPVIAAPAAALPNTVARPLQTLPPPTVAPPASVASQPPRPAIPPNPDAIPTAPPRPVAVAPTRPPPTPVPTPVAADVNNEYGPVKAGQTLSQIAAELQAGDGYSLDQAMVALLRANPDAFIADDINLIKRGAVLRVPQATEISSISTAEASALVRTQIDRWRDARRPAPQPAAVASANAPSTRVAAQATAPSPRRVADARLEIVPSAASRGTQAGTRSGASAAGEGEMLRQELQQSKEDLAARDAEVVELQARIAELEKLQQQQGQLITLKDSELAAAQQRLAESSRAGAASPATVASTTQSSQPAPAPVERDAWLWPLGIIVLAVAGLLGWWFSRRRRVVVEPGRKTFSTEALAAGIPSSAPSATRIDPVPVTMHDPDPRTPASGALRNVPEPVSNPPVADRSAASTAPTWHAGNMPHAASTLAVSTSPITHPVSGQESIELARAYIDLGDDETARGLLQEVVDVGDADARSAAARLLREMS